jgi:hypothetical protein
VKQKGYGVVQSLILYSSVLTRTAANFLVKSNYCKTLKLLKWFQSILFCLKTAVQAKKEKEKENLLHAYEAVLSNMFNFVRKTRKTT